MAEKRSVTAGNSLIAGVLCNSSKGTAIEKETGDSLEYGARGQRSRIVGVLSNGGYPKILRYFLCQIINDFSVSRNG